MKNPIEMTDADLLNCHEAIKKAFPSPEKQQRRFLAIQDEISRRGLEPRYTVAELLKMKPEDLR